MDTIRFAVMGTGRIADGVLKHIRAAEGCAVVAAASREVGRAREFADRHDLDVACTYDELLSRDDIDAVYVTLPNHLHASWSCRLMEAGKHVLCEKPLTPRRSEAERVAAVSETTGRVFQEGFMYLHHAQTNALLALGRDGESGGSAIGDLQFIHSWHCLDLRVPHAWTRFSHAMEGGAVMDLGVYPCSIARELTGEEPDEIRAAGVIGEPIEGETQGVDVDASISMRFPSGVLTSASCSLRSRAGVYLRMTGSWGSAWTDWPFQPDVKRAVIHVERFERHPDGAGRDEVVIEDGGERFEHQFAHFARACRGEVGPRPSLGWSIAQATMIERIHKEIGLDFGPGH